MSNLSRRNKTFLHKKYKDETGEVPADILENLVRQRNKWVVDDQGQLVSYLSHTAGTIEILSPEYVEWLEEQVLNQIENNV